MEDAETLGGLSKVKTGRLISFFSDITCGESCWYAKEEVCKCSCNGKNHGISLRGDNAVRTCKLDGIRYELVAVGKHSELRNEARKIQEAYDIQTGKAFYVDGILKQKTYSGGTMTYMGYADTYTGRGDYLRLKYASLPQCLKWKELEYFNIGDEKDRYHSNAAILWKKAE